MSRVKRRRGRPPHPDILTPAEWKVLNLIRHGVSNRRIARLRDISLDAVKFHVANLLMKLDVPDRAALRSWHGGPADSAHTIQTRKRRNKMPEPLRLGVIGQISREVSDIGKAVDWYSKVLGLPHLFTFGNLAFFDCAGTRLFLSLPEDGGPPKPQSFLYFRVDDIEAAHHELSARGAKFKGAPHMIHRHASGMEEWMASFEDPDGHGLALMSQIVPQPR